MKDLFILSVLSIVLAGCSSQPPSTANGTVSPPPSVVENSQPNKPAEPNVSGEFVKPLGKDVKPPKANSPSQPRDAADQQLMTMLKPDRSPDWRPTNKTASELASKVGKAMAALSDTKGTMYVVMETPVGRGYLNQELKIQDKRHFNISFAIMHLRPENCRVVADGKSKREQIDGNWRPPVPISKSLPDATSPADELAKSWPLSFTRTMWLGLTDGRDSWVPVISEWLRGTSGYQISVQERHVSYQGHDFVSYQIQGERTSQAAAKLGTSTIQIVIDGTHLLPVTVVSNNTDASGKNWKLTWGCHYYFKQKFTSKDF